LNSLLERVWVIRPRASISLLFHEGLHGPEHGGQRVIANALRCRVAVPGTTGGRTQDRYGREHSAWTNAHGQGRRGFLPLNPATLPHYLAGAPSGPCDDVPPGRRSGAARLDVNGLASCARYPRGYPPSTRRLRCGESAERAPGRSRRAVRGWCSAGVIVFPSCSEHELLAVSPGTLSSRYAPAKDFVKARAAGSRARPG
jgi:hypothetical protein